MKDECQLDRFGWEQGRILLGEAASFFVGVSFEPHNYISLFIRRNL